MFTKRIIIQFVTTILYRWARVYPGDEAERTAVVEAKVSDRVEALPAYIRIIFMILCLHVALISFLSYRCFMHSLTMEEREALLDRFEHSRVSSIRNLIRFVKTFTVFYWLDQQNIYEMT